MKYDVFISYSRKDTNVANRICKEFENAGVSYFIDRQGVAGGLEFPKVLASAILNSEIFLFLASRNSYESKFTNSEIVFAFNKKDKEKLLPYIIDSSSLPSDLDFVFSGINRRNIKEHPVETILLDDILCLLKRKRRTTSPKSIPSKSEPITSVIKDRKQIEYRPSRILSFKGRINRNQYQLTVAVSIIIAIFVSIGFWCSDYYWLFYADAPLATQITIISLFSIGAILLIWILLAAEAKRSADIGKPSFIAMVKSLFTEKENIFLVIYLLALSPIIFIWNLAYMIFLKDDYWHRK